MVLTDLTVEITNNADNRKFTTGVFIDLKKAFDTIDLLELQKAGPQTQTQTHRGRVELQTAQGGLLVKPR